MVQSWLNEGFILIFNQKMNMNKTPLAIGITLLAAGIIIVVVAALMMFCQERCFLQVDLELWPAALGILGIGLIAASNFILFFRQQARS